MKSFFGYLLRLLQSAFLILICLLSKPAFAQNPIAQFTVNGSTTGCAPLTVQFQNNSQNAVSYLWDFGNGNTSTLANPVTIYLTPGNFTVKLVAFGNGGLKDSLILPNYISTGVVPVADFVAVTTEDCEGVPISFTNQSQNFTSCLWDFGDGNTSTGTNPSHIYTSGGVYTITLIAYNGTQGCSHSQTRSQYITVNSKPLSSMAVNQASSCDVNQQFNFTSNTTGASSWQWNFGDGNISTQQNPAHVYAAAGSYSVQLISTSIYGCADTAMESNYVTILENTAPVISATAISGCTPLWTTLSANTTQPAIYSWDFGDGTTSNAQTCYKMYLGAGVFNARLQVSYANGCVSTSNIIVITAEQTPAATYYITGIGGCNPVNATFVNLTQGSGNTYLWNFGDATTSTQTSPVHSYTVQGNFLTSLTVTSPNGCSITANSAAVISVNFPNSSFTPSTTSGCPPLAVNFNSLNTLPGYSYSWNFGDGFSSTQADPSHTYSTSGSYNVILTVTDANGCTSSETYFTPIDVNSTVANFVPPAPVTACAPFTVNFSDNSFGANSWNWDFDDGTSSALQNPTHTFLSPGVYQVSLSTQNNGSGCSQYIPVYSTFNIIGGDVQFSYITERCPPYTAYFTDSSVSAVSWLWDFGDGATSTQQHPTHIYSSPGSYTVSLTITTSDGCTYTSTHNYAVNFEPLVAAPIAQTTDSIPPFTVQFLANSQGATGWFWDFGDGGTSTQQNPVYTFNGLPPYNISLTLTNDSCSYTYSFPSVEIGAGNNVVGTDSTTSHLPDPESGCAPLLLHFHNPVLNAASWLWDFGDGATSTLPDPSHLYTTPGLYDLMLITNDPWGNVDTLFQEANILVTGVTADFEISYSNSCQGNAITINNLSQNAVAYDWQLGDGSVSNAFAPTHIYSNASSNYVVSMFAYDSSGCSGFASQTFYGVPGNAITADKNRICAGDTIFFTSSNLSYDAYIWDFGDGDSSLLAVPYHIYSDSGNFSVSLTVLDTSGCAQVFSLPGTIMVSKPVADFIMSPPSSICYGVSHSFINLSTDASFYLWDFGDGTTSSVTNPVHTYSVPGYHTVTLTATQFNCVSTSSLPNAVYVTARNADFAFSKTNDCLPITVTFTDSSYDAVSWLWEFGDGTTSTLQNPIKTFTVKPLSDVRLTITDLYGCVDTISKQVVQPAIASIGMQPIEGCNPLTVSFIDSSENVSSYYWDFGNGQTSNQQSPVITYNQNGYYNVTLVVTSTDGCTDSLTVDSLVRVAGPVASFAINYLPGCAPVVADFIDNSQNVDFWNWDFGDSSSSSSSSPSHIYTLPGNYIVTLIVSDSVGCADTLQLQSNIQVAGPVASFSVSSSESCAPLNAQFLNNSANAFSYFWNFGDGDTSAVQQPYHQYTSPGNYFVSLIVQDSSGCESVFTLPDTLKVYENAVAVFNVSDTLGCAPIDITFINSSTGAVNYSWDFGDGTSSQQISPVHNYSGSGTYNVSLVVSATGGCNDTLSRIVNTYDSPAAAFGSNVTEGCSPLVVSFFNQSTGVSNATYSWDFGSGFTSTVQSPVTAFFIPGFYTVTLVVSNGGGCSDSITKTAYINVYDTNPPAIANIMSASVLSDTSAEITWQNVADPDLYAYKLFRLNHSSGLYDLIYTLVDTNSSGLNVVSSYIDTGLNTLANSYSYKVQTVDRCGNTIGLPDLIAHTTINITAITQGKNIEVSWNFYSGCTVDHYELYRQESSSTGFVLISNNISSTVQNFTDTTLECPTGYSYRVHAIALCGTNYFSLSDTSTAVPESELQNQFVDAVFASVVDDSFVELEWQTPAILPEKITGYEIYRSVDKVDYGLAGTTVSTETRFEDHTAIVHEQNYYYLIMPINTCSVRGQEGIIGSSVLLKSEFDEITETSELFWTPYELWQQGVEKYIIQRKLGNGQWETVNEVDGNTLHSDDR